MLDAYLWGQVNRISPEAPVPVVHVENHETRLGGAANVARNIAELKATAYLATIVGDDADADELEQLLSSHLIDSRCVIRSGGRKTSRKTRVLSSNQQIVRFDEETTLPITLDLEERLLDSIELLLVSHPVNAIVLQDYNKGVLTKSFIKKAIELANHKEIPVAVDPKKANFFEFENCTLFKPNWREVQESLNISTENPDIKVLESAAKRLCEELNATNIMITMGSQGVFIFNSAEGKQIAGYKRKVSDVSGAGDTVISVAALCLGQKTSMESAARLANLAGGLVCEEPGVVPISKNRLVKELDRLL